MNFKVKRTTNLQKLKKSYSDRQGVSLEYLRFHFDGRRIHDQDTPKMLEMEDGDLIDVFNDQTGGM